MFQLSHFEWEAPVWKEWLLLPVSSWNLLFWDYSGLNVRSLWIFQVNSNFCKPDVKILIDNDKIRCMHCSRQPSYHKHYFFVTSEEAHKMSLRINIVYIFSTMKSAVELNKLLLKFLLCHMYIQESSCEESARFNFLGITWESKRSCWVHFSGFHGA